MISKDIQMKLLGIIKNEMIPEYKSMELYKEKLKEEYVRYLEEFITERDRELISKYPDYIKLSNQVQIVYYGYGENEKIEYFSDYRMRDKGDLVINLDQEYPVVCDLISSLKEIDKKEWKKIGPLFNKYINFRNRYVKKVNLAYEFLSHKNTTITLIKKEFPELYTLYKA